MCIITVFGMNKINFLFNYHIVFFFLTLSFEDKSISLFIMFLRNENDSDLIHIREIDDMPY